MRHYKAALHYADWSLAEWGTLLTIVARGQVDRGANVQSLSDAFQSRFGVCRVFALDSGTSAIRLSLALLKLSRPGKTRVLVPAYICPSVVRTVQDEGCEAVPVDVGRDLNIEPTDLLRKISPNCLAVIAAHMYGCAAEIEDIAACCRGAGVPLIDDAAQVAGVAVNGRPLGTFGEFGVISFAQSKTIVTGVRHSGGLLLVNDPTWIEAATQAVAKLGESRDRLKQLLYFLLSMQVPATLRIESSRYDRLIEFLFPPPANDRPTKISNLEAAIALRQLERLPELIHTRIASIELIAKTLSDVPGLELPQVAPARFLTRLLVGLPAEIDREQVRRRLARAGVQTRLPYRTMFTQAEAPYAWALAPRLLELPCHVSLDEPTVHLMRRALATTMAEPSDTLRRSRASPASAVS